MSSPELAREREYVGGLYARLDELRREAEHQLEAVRLTKPGTHQGYSERDAFARIFEDRITQLRNIDERLAFGRLTLGGSQASDDQAANGEPTHRYIGRIGLRDDDLQPLLLDWRVPQARPFYQATAATPLGALARRHLTSKGREIVRIDDEVFDAELLESDGLELQGEAALMATLTAERTGRMSDIVATIQAQQDAIIRAELRGTLVVQGGPGTGKTAVALHRAAYLLYSHREQLSTSGVLIVGPSRSFLQYIEAVLPSLGETGVVLASVGQLYPGVETAIEDAPDVAYLKGSLEMARLLQRAVKSRQVVPTEPQVVDIDGEALTIGPELIRSAMEKAWDSRKPHNVARVTFNRGALAALTRQLADQLRKKKRTIDDSDLAYLREDVRQNYEVKVALNTAWLPLTPERLLQDLYARPNWLASLTPRWSPAQRDLLRRDRDAAFTVSDVALLDEAAELLGVADVTSDAERADARAQRKRDLQNARAAIENMGVEGLVDARALADGFQAGADLGTTSERAAADRSWTYGHIVVDEAQELSPMQWRVLFRRNPLKSFTVVGDVAQASAAAGSTSWQEALRPFVKPTADGHDGFRLEELTVNYRTPAQIVAVAERMAEAHGVRITSSRAVREGDHPVEFVIQDDVARAVRTSVQAIVEADRGGTIAVIAPESVVGPLGHALDAAFGTDVGRGHLGLTRQIALLTPQESKGLEFDEVVVVEPQRIVDEIPRGASALYVAMTRPTQRLVVVSSAKLPAGLDPAS